VSSPPLGLSRKLGLTPTPSGGDAESWSTLGLSRRLVRRDTTRRTRGVGASGLELKTDRLVPEIDAPEIEPQQSRSTSAIEARELRKAKA